MRWLVTRYKICLWTEIQDTSILKKLKKPSGLLTKKVNFSAPDPFVPKSDFNDSLPMLLTSLNNGYARVTGSRLHITSKGLPGSITIIRECWTYYIKVVSHLEFSSLEFHQHLESCSNNSSTIKFTNPRCSASWSACPVRRWSCPPCGGRAVSGPPLHHPLYSGPPV